jgi:hypothetical protein
MRKLISLRNRQRQTAKETTDATITIPTNNTPNKITRVIRLRGFDGAGCESAAIDFCFHTSCHYHFLYAIFFEKSFDALQKRYIILS